MAGGGAAARAGEHVAEGIIAKAAKDVLRDAAGPGARAAENAGAHGAESAATRATAAGLSDAERAAARDALNNSRHAFNSTRDDLTREFPQLSHETNPHFGTGLDEYTQNCQSCVVAVDRSLEGTPTEAFPRLLNEDRSAFLPDSRFAWPSSAESQIGRGNVVHSVGGYDDIAHEMLQAGDGARGVIHGMRLGPNGEYLSGHVFNVVNKDGVLHFIDGQTNMYANPERFGGFEFIRTR